MCVKIIHEDQIYMKFKNINNNYTYYLLYIYNFTVFILMNQIKYLNNPAS